MIRLTGINNKEFILNSDQIEKLEEVPESVITMVNGNKYIVNDSLDEIVNKIIEYKRRLFLKSDFM
ncbi:MAG: flagellar FlbD family protein [Bacillota bacterium]|nr:flagellar FlbD family protein [Bacillota bacterium]